MRGPTRRSTWSSISVGLTCIVLLGMLSSGSALSETATTLGPTTTQLVGATPIPSPTSRVVAPRADSVPCRGEVP